MKELTPEIRLKIVIEWIKRGGKNYMNKEDFIKKVCQLKGIKYE